MSQEIFQFNPIHQLGINRNPEVLWFYPPLQSAVTGGISAGGGIFAGLEYSCRLCVWLECASACLMTCRLCAFPFHCLVLSLATRVALQAVIKIYLLFRIILEGRWCRWVGRLHIKLLSLQLRNLHSGVLTQNKYYFKVNKLLGWLVKCLILSKTITAK